MEVEKEVVAEVVPNKPPEEDPKKKPTIIVYGPLDQRISETFY